MERFAMMPKQDTDMDRIEEDNIEETMPVEDELVEEHVDEEPRLTPEQIESHLQDCDEMSRQCIDQLLEELVGALESRQRALADFKNFQRRSTENEQRMSRIATAGALRGVLPVLDQMGMALQQDPTQVDGDKILDGVQIIRDELEKVLMDQGVERIEPDIGAEFDPNRHEAMLKQEADGVEPGHIVQVLQVGYQVRDQVLRTAKVAVAP
jgi:molecular chaperone GrpE